MAAHAFGRIGHNTIFAIDADSWKEDIVAVVASPHPIAVTIFSEVSSHDMENYAAFSLNVVIDCSPANAREGSKPSTEAPMTRCTQHTVVSGPSRRRAGYTGDLLLGSEYSVAAKRHLDARRAASVTSLLSMIFIKTDVCAAGRNVSRRSRWVNRHETR